MVVGRVIFHAGALCLCAAGWAGAQVPTLDVSVNTTSPEVDEPFFLTVKASGSRVGQPNIPNVPGLVLANPRTANSMVFVNGTMSQTTEYGFTAIATNPGPMTIPPITITIDGRVRRSKPIEITVMDLPVVRAWVESHSVTVREPFRIYVSVVGENIERPGVPEVDDLLIDPEKTTLEESVARRDGKSMSKHTYGIYALAKKGGAFTVPAISVIVDGATHRTSPIQMKASFQRPLNPGSGTNLYKEDLVFTRAEVDKREVYQGEPIVLSMQLWRIIHGGIESGSHPRAVIRPPSTEGFYEALLEPRSDVRKSGSWEYNVIEDRKVLYPTTTGELVIGSWHWEGRAYVPSRNRRSRFLRDAYPFKLDSDPIKIVVKPLPARPPEFSGAVGAFTIDASLSETTMLQGVPVKLEVVISGEGNPDAIGDPLIAKPSWAFLSVPKRETRTRQQPDRAGLVTVKRFTYTLTPLKPGNVEWPAIGFTYFDPAKAEYITKTVGPFSVAVESAGDAGQRLVLSDEVSLAEREVSVMGEDIRPPAPRPSHLRVERSLEIAAPTVGILPVVLFLLLVLYTARQRRFQTDRGFARAYHARTKAVKGLSSVRNASHPADELYRSLVSFVGDIFNVDDAGLTSADVENLLRDRGVDAGLAEGAVKVLRACERSRYASQELSTDEINALLAGAEICVDRLRRYKSKGARR